MSVAEIKLTKALAKGELVQYLGGHPAYSIQERYADMPTDYSAAFNPIDKRIMDDAGFLQMVVDAIKSLAEDPEYGWGAIFHIENLALLRNSNGIGQPDPGLLESVASSLRKNKEAYISLKRWIGKDFEDGVWGMVRIINRNLHKDENITVLPEEL